MFKTGDERLYKEERSGIGSSRLPMNMRRPGKEAWQGDTGKVFREEIKEANDSGDSGDRNL